MYIYIYICIYIYIYVYLHTSPVIKKNAGVQTPRVSSEGTWESSKDSSVRLTDRNPHHGSPEAIFYSFYGKVYYSSLVFYSWVVLLLFLLRLAGPVELWCLASLKMSPTGAMRSPTGRRR